MKGPYAIQSPQIRYEHMQQMVKWYVREYPDRCDPMLIVEVGSWLGASAIAWAKAMDKANVMGLVWCIDPWKPYHDHSQCDVVSKMNKLLWAHMGDDIEAQFWDNVRLAGVENRVHTIRSTFLHALRMIQGADINILYLDGSHYHEDIERDLSLALHQTKSHVLCGDDLESLVGVGVTRAECISNAAYDTVNNEDGSWYHPGVSLAVHFHLGNDVTVYDGFWIAGDVNIYD